MIDIVKMNHDFSDIDLINKWVIAHDTGGDSFLEEAKQKYGGNSLIGFVYVDHQAGISLEIETFCTVGADGDITPTQGPRDHNASWKLRYGVLKQMKIELIKNFLHLDYPCGKTTGYYAKVMLLRSTGNFYILYKVTLWQATGNSQVKPRSNQKSFSFRKAGMAQVI